jgi:hypothetical protein
MSVTATPTLTAHLYPWDVVGDPDAPARLVDAGVRRVALAAAYHAVRAATPRHPRHRIVDAPRGALYVRLREAVWAGHELVPRDAAEWFGPDSFARARDALGTAGIEVAGWVALTHSCSTGTRFAAHAVENAFGDRYAYALCPSNPAARRYAATLAAEVVAAGGVDGLVIEAAGQLGLEHASPHEKSAGAGWGPHAAALLSICFCPRCDRLYDAAGGRPDEWRRDIAVALDDDSAAREVQERLAPIVLATRLATASQLLGDVVAQARDAGARRLTVFADPDPWVTGATFSPGGPLDGIERWLLPCFGDPTADTARLASLAHIAPAPIAAYVNLLTADFAETVDARLDALHQAGVRHLHGYHYGLASQGRIDAMTAAIARSPFGKDAS